jgi:DNA-binding GntR family transcriptional regulator
MQRNDLLPCATTVSGEFLGESMRPIPSQPSLVDQVVEAITAEIADGTLASNARLIQDELARAYGVSRQPVQQALLLLRNHGLVREAPGRGLIVSPLDVEFVRNIYQIRTMLDGLAARLAAQNGAERARREGRERVARGFSAVERGSLTDQIVADIEFHAFVGELSGNPLIGETTRPHWPYLRRIMGEVLRGDEGMPRTIWDEHAAILDAIIAGDGDRAETLSREHVSRAADFIAARLQSRDDASREERRRRRLVRPQ